MPALSIILILVSVLLSASAQILMKAGMSSAAVQETLQSGQIISTIPAVAMSPFVLLGLLSFGLSALVWLLVLSKIDVGQAYPFVALGIVATSIAGHLLFHEAFDAYRALGIGLIVIGVVVVGLS